MSKNIIMINKLLYLYTIIFLTSIPIYHLSSQQSKYFIKFRNIQNNDIGDSPHIGGGAEDGSNIVSLDNNNFFVAGAQLLLTDHHFNAHVYKIDQWGDIIWEKKYNQHDQTYSTGARGFLSTPKQQLLMVSDLYNPDIDLNWIYFMKIDTSGNLLTEKTIGRADTTHWSKPFQLRPTSDGHFFVVGEMAEIPNQLKPYIVKITETGETLWDTAYVHYHTGGFLDIAPAPVGGYYVLGGISITTTSSSTSGVLLTHIDEQGHIIKDYTYDVGFNSYGSRLYVTSEDEIFITGGGASEGEERTRGTAFCCKLNTNKEIVWFTSNLSDERQVNAVVKPKDNTLVLISEHAKSNSLDLRITKLNATNGTILWERTYGKKHDTHFIYDCAQTTDEGFLACGRLAGRDENDESIDGLYLIKTNCMGLLTTPQAHFTTQTTAHRQTLQFTNHSQFVYPDSIDGGFYHWDFGDGTSSSEHSPIHDYAEAGKYTVQLTAIVCTDTATTTQTLHIKKQGTLVTPTDSTYFSLPQPHPITLHSLLPYHLEGSVNQALLQVYNIAGQHIHTYTLEERDGQIALTYQDFPSGVYFFRLMVNGEVRQEEKVVFVK